MMKEARKMLYQQLVLLAEQSNSYEAVEHSKAMCAVYRELQATVVSLNCLRIALGASVFANLIICIYIFI